MKLSPLQSRLAASVIASCLLIVLYLSLFSPHFALAAELKDVRAVWLDDVDDSPELAAPRSLNPAYEPDFALFDRSLLGRQTEEFTSIGNNEEGFMNLEPGSTHLFRFSESSTPARGLPDSPLELRNEHNGTAQEGRTADAGVGGKPAKRQNARRVYISANTCLRPDIEDASRTAPEAPQLTMYVSTSPSNLSPGPLAPAGTQDVVEFIEGAVMYNFTTSGDVLIGIHAPNITATSNGIYNVAVAGSTDAYFHTYNDNDDADLIWVDSDSQGALLITHNLTESNDISTQERVMSMQPYVMFAQNKDSKSINGIKFSYCALNTFADIQVTKNGKLTNMVTTGMTKRGPGGFPKQQFYFSGLNSSSSYFGILASVGNASVNGRGQIGGGGHVYKAMNFTTKSDHGNCAIVLNLDFCDQVAYSVPSNPDFGNSTQLAKFYDDYAASMYQNFNMSLAQVACEAPVTQRYSLARTCDDCAAAYKNWLCSVTIPRCEDFSNEASYLQPRAMAQEFPKGGTLDDETRKQFPNSVAFNSSRNPRIDEIIKPGPYKEVLPCEDLCYNLVQSCPASMGFSCPQPHDPRFRSSYGQRKTDSSGMLTCNYQGSAHVFSGAGRLSLPWVPLGAAALAAGMGLLLL